MSQTINLLHLTFGRGSRGGEDARLFATFAISRVIAHGHVVHGSPRVAIFSHAVAMVFAFRHILAKRAIGQTVGG